MIILASESTSQNPLETLVPRLNQLSDIELIEQCRSEIPHQMDGFRELLARYESSVYETCFRLVADKQSAERICEDAFLQVFHQLHNFLPCASYSNLKTWIFQIVFRLCELHLESAAVNRFAEPAGPTDTMARALRLLDHDDRNWIVLRFVGGLEVREIAEVLEVGGIQSKEKLYNALCRFAEASELIA